MRIGKRRETLRVSCSVDAYARPDAVLFEVRLGPQCGRDALDASLSGTGARVKSLRGEKMAIACQPSKEPFRALCKALVASDAVTSYRFKYRFPKPGLLVDDAVARAVPRGIGRCHDIAETAASRMGLGLGKALKTTAWSPSAKARRPAEGWKSPDRDASQGGTSGQEAAVQIPKYDPPRVPVPVKVSVEYELVGRRGRRGKQGADSGNGS